MFDQDLTFASQALEVGNLAASEILCRDVLDKGGDDVVALTLLGRIAHMIGSTDRAADYFRAALAIEPNNAEVLNRLQAAIDHGPIESSSEPRFLLIKSWGFGFWSDVSQVLGSLLLAEVTGRIPVTPLPRGTG